MKVLACHNFYQQPGGEDQSYRAEVRLLESRGHEVVQFTRHNDAIDQMGCWKVACKTVWNSQTYSDLRGLIRRERPSVMHCTNIFPLISPAAYSAARAEGVPVVQSLRNYRMFCGNSLLMRDGQVCEDCLGKRIAWPAIAHGCYRQSRAASAVVAAMQAVHRAGKTWRDNVDRYVALTEFQRQKYVAAGLPGDKISVKPNFVFPDPGPGVGQGGYAVFAGRLSEEKGIDVLLEAWRRVKCDVPLKIVGDGPMANRVQEAARQLPRIQWLGTMAHEQLLSLIGEAVLLVVPSICYEAFPRTIVEAYAKGTPVVGSRLGAAAELVHDGRTGSLFAPGDAVDLAHKIDRLYGEPATMQAMRSAARHEYDDKYTVDANYDMLMAIYEQVIAEGPQHLHLGQPRSRQTAVATIH